MRLGHNLETAQKQKLILTPELKQCLNVLQLNQLELNEHINEILLDNPVLEKEDKRLSDSVLSLAKERSVGQQHSTNQKDNSSDEWKYYSSLSQQPTLHEHLKNQLGVMKLSEKNRAIVDFLIDSINDNGYLECELQEIAASTRLKTDVLEFCLDIIQSMDPSGVGARNLSECIQLQFTDDDTAHILAASILDNSLNDLANNRIGKIAKDHQTSIEKIKSAIEVIRATNPKPGSSFKKTDMIPYIKPDVLVYWDEEKISVTVDTRYSCPTLHLSRLYVAIMENKNTDKPTKDYINKKINSGAMLIKSIDQRKETIQKVSEAIVLRQKDFFNDKMGSLITLKMKDIASDVDMHESTVSRAINGKYLQCPHGTYPLKHFFQSGVQTEDGNMSSSDDVKKHIKELIHSENRNKPLSDQKIADILCEQGIQVSRRTVAKYRTQMDIPATSKRKEY